MKFDQVSKDLLAGARFIERYGFERCANHPLTAVARTLQAREGGLYTSFRSHAHRERYDQACTRIFNAAGLDQRDLSPEEAIDVLVAAAFWKVPR
jgi:hypothetical protein